MDHGNDFWNFMMEGGDELLNNMEAGWLRKRKM
jgi:hypothetical protein